MKQRRGRARALSALFALATLSCLGHPTSHGDGSELVKGYRILDFTALGDSAIALRLETWQVVNPPDTAPWPRTGFALLDRKTGTVRALDTLPIAAAATFPRWFFACDSGKPVSVHPPGLSGPPGTCADSSAPSVTANGYLIVFVDSAATVRLFNRNLEPFELLATGARRVKVLDAESDRGIVSILEDRGRGDSLLWRGFSVDDPSGGDSAWLTSPGLVRVQGMGTALVCNAADEAAASLPCWSPGTTGFRDAFAEAAGSVISPEWNPDTGLLTYLDGTARFVFVNPVSGARESFEAGAILAGYRP